jgi:hypothetical protein
LIIATKENEILAYGCIRKTREIRLPFVQLFFPENIIYLHSFFTFPEFRGKGLYPSLVAEASRKYGKVYLAVSIHNKPSLRAISKLKHTKVCLICIKNFLCFRKTTIKFLKRKI